MRLCEITPDTTVGVYDAESGEYFTLGSGFEGSDDARVAAEETVSGNEFVLVAELAHLETTVEEEASL
jgi:hypothetical protein